MSLKLIKLTKTYENQLGEMIDEWKADQDIKTPTLIQFNYSSVAYLQAG